MRPATHYLSLDELTDDELLAKLHSDLRADFVRLPSNGKLTAAQLDAIFPPTPERDTALCEILQMGMRRAREKSHT